MNTVSRVHPLNHYNWGAGCDGWNLVDERSLSVKQERMPPHTAEQLHFHQESRQFFFILKGEAVFEAGDSRVRVQSLEGFHIQPGIKHRIMNEGDEDLEFLLCSQPSTTNDRINCE